MFPCFGEAAEEWEPAPALACWFWGEKEFERDGYRAYLDLIADRSHFQILTTSLRVPDRELTDTDTRSQIEEAVGYARSLGIGIAMDLDVRLARSRFLEQYPDEAQWMLRIRDTTLDEHGDGSIRIQSAHLSDHYTHRTTPYVALSGRVERIFSYDRTESGEIREGSVSELETGFEIIASGSNAIEVRFDLAPSEEGRTVCLAAAFEHFTPAVFAPHLMKFQEELLELYRDTPLVGVCKDEWGFPPDFTGCPEKNDYWYSGHRAQAYAKMTGGRDLIRDCLLMTHGEEGREAERNYAINRFLKMSYLRNGEIETHFYATTKRVFGEDALVATHPTWYPFPGVQEFKKNGLDWWIATRDLAQTDETTPYSVRTSLTKKWGSPVWCNMYYSRDPEDYPREMWRGVLAGGRINYHPPWPTDKTGGLMEGQRLVTNPDRMLGDRRVRLLDRISNAPLDCRVAVLFGHAGAMNWTHSNYANTGISLADRFWRAGHPADLIPSSEIWNESLTVTEEGSLRYGPQTYDWVVLVNPEFEPEETFDLLDRVLPETVLIVGERSRDFEGNPVNPLRDSRPNFRIVRSEEEALEKGLVHLEKRGIPSQSPSTQTLSEFGYTSSAPDVLGTARLVDGTHLFVQGKQTPSGDPVHSKFTVDGNDFHADFEGVLGVRFGDGGRVIALAAGGLKSFLSEEFSLALDKRLDFALQEGGRGGFLGYHYANGDPLPEALLELTEDWTALPTSNHPIDCKEEFDNESED